MRKIFLVLILILLSKLSFAQYLPEETPADLRITYTTTKGLLNSSETIYLSSDSCYYETIFQDITNRFNFFVTNKDMKELYGVLNKYEIESIRTKQLQRAAPERMGDNLLIQWDNFQSITIVNSGNFILEDKWLNNWKKIVKNIRKYVKMQQDDRSRNFTVKFDESFTGKKVAMYLSNDFLYDNTLPEINIEGFFVTLASVPGTYYLKVVVSDVNFAETFKVDLTEGTEVSLSLKGNSIIKN